MTLNRNARTTGLEADNLKVVASLRGFFQALGQHDAVLGRNATLIAVDTKIAPGFLIDDEVMREIFSGSKLKSDGPESTSMIFLFSAFFFDGRTGILLMSLAPPLHGSNAFLDPQFPGLNEARNLIRGLPQLTDERSAMCDEIHGKAMELCNAAMTDHLKATGGVSAEQQMTPLSAKQRRH